MKNWFQILLFVLLFAAVAFCCFFICIHYMVHPKVSPVDHHHLIHGQLNITAEQEARLGPIEDKFEHRKEKLFTEIHAANQELSDALILDKGDTPRVRSAVANIQRIQGDLQQSVLDHVFDMRTVLTAEQYDRLVKLTARALHEPSEPR